MRLFKYNNITYSPEGITHVAMFYSQATDRWIVQAHLTGGDRAKVGSFLEEADAQQEYEDFCAAWRNARES